MCFSTLLYFTQLYSTVCYFHFELFQYFKLNDIVFIFFRKYGIIFINDGVGSMRRMAKKIQKDRCECERVGVIVRVCECRREVVCVCVCVLLCIHLLFYTNKFWIDFEFIYLNNDFDFSKLRLCICIFVLMYVSVHTFLAYLSKLGILADDADEIYSALERYVML